MYRRGSLEEQQTVIIISLFIVFSFLNQDGT